MKNFLDTYNEKKRIIEDYIKELFRTCSYPQKNLNEIMEYAVTNGGKRIRPILMYASFEAYSHDTKRVMPFCAAIEMIHSYSLVHDDLPAMDNDTLRRGKPTAHVKFSHFGAILAGDALLNMAFETMLGAPNFAKSEHKAMKIIADASGAGGMCAGQMTDMEGSADDYSKLAQMYAQKTGALLLASVLAGAVLGGADEKQLKLLEEYSTYLGLIFQIKDDILDVTSTNEEMGKSVNSDEKNNKMTFVSRYGLEKAEEILCKYEDKALAVLKKTDGDTEFLKEITRFMAQRNN